MTGFDLKQYDLYLEAPAKINLVLRVLQRREDGYHELVTWMQKVSLCDRIGLTILDNCDIQLRCSDRQIPVDHNNLVYRAVDLFFCRSKKAKGCGASVFLEKRIPVSAGLGGGSSDAGTVLKGLNTYFGNEFNSEELVSMGRLLGADVPFFTTDMAAVLATGIGEKMLQVSSLQDCTIILVNPGFFVSTSWVFKKFALTRADKNFKLTGSRMIDTGALDLDLMENDLEAVTMSHHPIIHKIKTELKDLGADKVLMSGSGPTVFGIFRDPKKKRTEIQGAIDVLRQKFGERVFEVEPRDGV